MTDADGGACDLFGRLTGVMEAVVSGVRWYIELV
jgi:hypothetical protein